MGDINQIQILGRLGGDAEFRFTQSGKEVATFTVATDTGWHDKEKGEWHENTQWHRVVTFQPGLIGVLKDKAKKGVRVIVNGEMSYRTWRKDGEAADRQLAELIVGNDGKINFIDRDKAL
jgi:single-strand DNA-binding protein